MLVQSSSCNSMLLWKVIDFCQINFQIEFQFCRRVNQSDNSMKKRFSQVIREKWSAIDENEIVHCLIQSQLDKLQRVWYMKWCQAKNSCWSRNLTFDFWTRALHNSYRYQSQNLQEDFCFANVTLRSEEFCRSRREKNAHWWEVDIRNWVQRDLLRLNNC